MLIVMYIFAFALVANPFVFGFSRVEEKVLLMLFAFFTGLLIPLVAILMMRALNLLKDLQLEDRRDRIFPFIATGIFYLWMIRNLWQNPDVPMLLKASVLGLVIALFVSFFINNFEKLSVHAVGMGNLFAVVMVQSLFYSEGPFEFYFGKVIWSVDPVWFLAITVFVAGAVGSARLYLGKHRPDELFLGYVVGIASQFLAFYIMNR